MMGWPTSLNMELYFYSALVRLTSGRLLLRSIVFATRTTALYRIVWLCIDHRFELHLRRLPIPIVSV